MAVLTAYLATQCAVPGAASVQPRCYLFLGPDGSDALQGATLVSPAFAHLYALFQWTKENGWIMQSHDSRHPGGVFVKEQSPLDSEVARLKAGGGEAVSLQELAARFASLGYTLDRDLDCRCTATDCRTSEAYPCITTGVKETDTGRSAFHFESRRDKNFGLMQDLRGSVFAIVRGALFTA